MLTSEFPTGTVGKLEARKSLGEGLRASHAVLKTQVSTVKQKFPNFFISGFFSAIS